MSEPADITAFIWSHNEAHRFERCLMKLRPFVRRIVVADNGSTDGTVLIAQRWADEVYPYPEVPMTKRVCPDFVSGPGDWILGIDADEELTDQCTEQLPWLTQTHWDSINLLRLSRVYYRDHVEQTEVLHHLRLWRGGSVEPVSGFHTMPRPKHPERCFHTPYIAMLHDKADWEQRRDVEQYYAEGTLGPDAEKVMDRWRIQA